MVTNDFDVFLRYEGLRGDAEAGRVETLYDEVRVGRGTHFRIEGIGNGGVVVCGSASTLILDNWDVRVSLLWHLEETFARAFDGDIQRWAASVRRGTAQHMVWPEEKEVVVRSSVVH